MNRTLISEVEGESVTTLPPWPPTDLFKSPEKILYKCESYGGSVQV